MVAQRSAGDRFGCGADVGKGWTRSQGRGGRGIDSVQSQRWVGGGLGPGAEVGGYEPSPVVSDERSPKCTCSRIGASRTKLRCAVRTQRTYMRPAESAPRDYGAAGVSTRQTRHSVRRRRRSGGFASVGGADGGSRSGLCGLRRGSWPWLRQDATGGAALQRIAPRCNGCRCVQQVAERCGGRCIVAGCAAMQHGPLCPVGPTLGVL